MEEGAEEAAEDRVMSDMDHARPNRAEIQAELAQVKRELDSAIENVQQRDRRIDALIRDQDHHDALAVARSRADEAEARAEEAERELASTKAGVVQAFRDAGRHFGRAEHLAARIRDTLTEEGYDDPDDDSGCTPRWVASLRTALSTTPPEPKQPTELDRLLAELTERSEQLTDDLLRECNAAVVDHEGNVVRPRDEAPEWEDNEAAWGSPEGGG